MQTKTVAESQLLYHPWERANKYVYSSVNDFHHYRIGSKETGLKYVLEGEEQYKVGTKTHTVKKGSCLVVNPGQDYDIHIKKDSSSAEGICVSLDNKLLNEIYLNNLLSDEQLADYGTSLPENEFQFCEMVYDSADVLSTHLEYLSRLQDRQTGAIHLPQEEIFYGVAKSLLISQSRVKKHSDRINASRMSTRMELYKRINQAKQKLEDEPESNASMGEIASAVCMSEYHFIRIFKEAMKITPNQYRQKIKIEKARALILQTKMPLHEIAFVMGFTDVQNLSKVFKKYFSVPPGKYRGLGNR